MDLSKTNIELVERVYKTLESNIALFKARKGNSLTLAEKILYGHARNISETSLTRGKDFGDFFKLLRLTSSNFTWYHPPCSLH